MRTPPVHFDDEPNPFEPEGRVRQAAAPAVSSPDDLRAKGWAVAVHNDYRLNGQRFTFWLMTKGGVAVKGEGATDAEALDVIRREIDQHRLDWECKARKAGSAGGNTPADCDWPVCGCDPTADKVIAALEESGALNPLSTTEAQGAPKA